MKEENKFSKDFSTTEKTTELKPKLLKGVGREEKKRGRQRTDDEVQELFYWCFRAVCRLKPYTRTPPKKISVWPRGCSEDMIWYYSAYYVDKPNGNKLTFGERGKSHEKYVEWWRNFGEQFSTTEKTTEKSNSTGLGEIVDLNTRRENRIG